MKIKRFGQKLKSRELPLEELQETWRDDSSSKEYIAINDNGDAYYHGRLIVPAKKEKEHVGFNWRETGATIGPDWKAIKEWCEAKKYWPNCWQSNDHGNVSLYTNKGKFLGGLV